MWEVFVELKKNRIARWSPAASLQQWKLTVNQSNCHFWFWILIYYKNTHKLGSIFCGFFWLTACFSHKQTQCTYSCCTCRDTNILRHRKTHSYRVVIKVVNSSRYSIFQWGPASRLQSITKYITEHFPPEERGRRKEKQRENDGVKGCRDPTHSAFHNTSVAVCYDVCWQRQRHEDVIAPRLLCNMPICEHVS